MLSKNKNRSSCSSPGQVISYSVFKIERFAVKLKMQSRKKIKAVRWIELKACMGLPGELKWDERSSLFYETNDLNFCFNNAKLLQESSMIFFCHIARSISLTSLVISRLEVPTCAGRCFAASPWSFLILITLFHKNRPTHMCSMGDVYFGCNQY